MAGEDPKLIQPDDHNDPNDPPSLTAMTEESAGVQDVVDTSPRDERVAALMAHTIDVPVLASAVEQQEAADAADTIEQLEDQDAVELLEKMDDAAAAGALAEMQMPLAVGVVEDLVDDDPAYAGRLLELMAPDDAADLLGGLDETRRNRMLATMPTEAVQNLAALLGYDEESAGGLMTTDYLALRLDLTIQQATEEIRSSDVSDEVQYALVVDDDHHLVGAIGLRLLLVAQPNEKIGELMNRSVKAVRPEVDREEVASSFDRYDFNMLAVVDESNRLLGVVTVDDVIDIIRAEQTEDVQKTVGAGAGEAVYSPLQEKLRGRFPWMMASLVLTAMAAGVIIIFEDTIARLPMLAYFMPIIAALAGNAGHQSLAVTLRGIVLEEVRKERIGPLVLRETAVGLVIGTVFAIVIFGTLWFLGRHGETPGWPLGVVAGIATVISMSVGTLAGSCIPLIMRRLGVDPAQASAIFLIMITDAVSFASLLFITSLLYSMLTP